MRTTVEQVRPGTQLNRACDVTSVASRSDAGPRGKALHRLVTGALATLLLAAPAWAQFVIDNTALPAQLLWTDGVVIADIEGDGDNDIVFANGFGYGAGGAREQHLFLNTGSGFFVAAHSNLNVAPFNAKMVIAEDVDNDGDLDLVYAPEGAAAVPTQVPRLLINQGGGLAVFADESAARLPTRTMASFSVCAGDIDDDGDLDLVFTDGATFGGIARQVILYENDGSGFFTDITATNMPVDLYNAQDATLFDFDGDFDIDIAVSGKGQAGKRSRLYLNDGSGAFSVSTILNGLGTSMTYEVEWGDLDGDDDFDAAVNSISGASEGWARNDGTGQAMFESTFPGPNGHDDNEMALLDYDNDGDLDVFVGSLGTQEKLYENNGDSTFTNQNSIIQISTDSTLDIGFGDLDGDGTYDMVTAQGESGIWTNKVYINSGAVDTLPPLLLDNDSPSISTPETVFHMQVRDAISDDGVVNVTMTFEWIRSDDLIGATGVAAFDMGAGLFRMPVPTTASTTWACVTATAFDSVGNKAVFEPVVCPPAATLDDVVTGLLTCAHPPGKKDTIDTLCPMRIGYALWDVGEEHGGYNAAVAELHHDSGCPLPVHECLETAGKTTAVDDMTDPIFPSLFTEPWARFTYVNDPVGSSPGLRNNDFELAFENTLASDINFFSVQATVFAPYRPDPCAFPTVFETYPYPNFSEFVAGGDGLTRPGLAADAGLTLTQNIGFANNFLFPTGHIEYNATYPLITKHPITGVPMPVTIESCLTLAGIAGHTPAGIPTLAPQMRQIPCYWGPLLNVTDCGTSTTVPDDFYNIVPSLLHPDVASDLWDDLAYRVNPVDGGDPDPFFPEGLVAYNLIGAEYETNYLAGVDALAQKVVTACDCTVINAACYFDCLSNSDYSVASYVHFRAWLEDKYTPLGGISALAAAWGVPAIASCIDFDCDDIDPLLTSVGGPDDAFELETIYADWNDFQEHQRNESESFQYRAAKQSRPDDRMYAIEVDLPGCDRGALYSDGVALASWYDTNTNRTDIQTPMKKRALHAVAYGESLNFPLFGMPRFFPQICPGGGAPDGTPSTFLPPCWDFDFCNRTLREFIALGVDSLGIAYWENVTLWTLNDPPPDEEQDPCGAPLAGDNYSVTQNSVGGGQSGGRFRPLALGIENQLPGSSVASNQASDANMCEAMATEVASWRTKRAFMTPWRSPLLVHTGFAAAKRFGGSSPGFPPYLKGCPTDFVIDLMGKLQVQYAPFTDLAGFDDMWLVSERELLFSPFVPELDVEQMNRYAAEAEEHGWNLLVLTDRTTLDAIVADGAFVPQCADDPDCTLVPIELGIAVQYDMLPVGGGTRWAAVGFDDPSDPDTQDAIEASLLGDAQLGLDILTPGRTLRPVTAVVTETGKLAKGVDVTVMSDGVNLIVAAADTVVDRTIELEVDASLVKGLVIGYSAQSAPEPSTPPAPVGVRVPAPRNDDESSGGYGGTAGGSAGSSTGSSSGSSTGSTAGSTGGSTTGGQGDADGAPPSPPASGSVGLGLGGATGAPTGTPQANPRSGPPPPPTPVNPSEIEELATTLYYLPADIEDGSGTALADIPGLVGDLNLAIDVDIPAALDALDLAGFDVRAGSKLLLELDFVQDNDGDALEKLVAGLARLRRMMFLAYNDVSGDLTVRDIDGVGVESVRVQLEFPMQNHARRDIVAVTNASGVLNLTTLETDPVPDAEVWDFRIASYTIPGPLDPHILEIHAQHPVYETQSVLTVDLGP